MARLVTLTLVSRCHRVGTCTLVHTWKERLSTIFNPCRFSLSLSFLPRSMSPPPPLVPVSFYLFLPALSTHPLFIRAPPVHVHARAHTPSLTLSATTSVLHSKALTSETSASTSKDGFIGYSFPPRARDAAGQTENFNRDRREV